MTGQACEAFEKDCYDLLEGKYEAGQLSFKYTFSDYWVTGTFESASQNELSGKLFSDKCGCDVPKTLHRVE